MQGRERVSNGVGLDHATIKHGRFGGSQAALTVLVVDQWQNTCVLCGGGLAMSGAVVFQHGLDQVRKQCARHQTELQLAPIRAQPRYREVSGRRRLRSRFAATGCAWHRETRTIFFANATLPRPVPSRGGDASTTWR